MPDLPRAFLALLAPIRRLVPGATFHHRALEAAACGRYTQAGWLIESALVVYRHEMAIEPIARLRVHELMIRARQTGATSSESPELLEIVQRLNRLDRLERISAPFDLCDAREVLTEWIEGGVPTGEVDTPWPDAAPPVTAAA